MTSLPDTLCTPELQPRILRRQPPILAVLLGVFPLRAHEVFHGRLPLPSRQSARVLCSPRTSDKHRAPTLREAKNVRARHGTCWWDCWRALPSARLLPWTAHPVLSTPDQPPSPVRASKLGSGAAPARDGFLLPSDPGRQLETRTSASPPSCCKLCAPHP